jgi:serine/threonine-protein kinase
MEKSSTLSPPAPPRSAPPDRLESWKEIATYLNRDMRTVQRWEQTKGLPVRRLPGGDMARVYALKSELDAWWSSRGIHLREATSPESLPSIAVLPFANLSADKENEYFSDGLADDIIDALTKLPGLRVIARTSAFAFRDRNIRVSEIGSKLKVATVLEGSVRRTGSRIRVSAQLIKTADQSHLWSEHYDREITDVFAIQDEISQAIVEKLRVQLATDRPLIKRRTDNLEAYNLFLRGRHCIFRLTPESLAKGKEYLEQAIALDPDYALPYTGMAEYYWASACWGSMAGSDAVPRAKNAALSALKRDDTLAEAHAQLGVAKGNGDFDWTAAKQEFQRALELNPASPIVHYYYGVNWLRPMGQLDEELSEAQRFVELDPLSARYNAALGYAYDVTGLHDLAIEQYRRATDLDPSMAMPHGLLADAYGRMGRFEEATAEAERACELSRRNPRMLAYLAWVHGRAGRPDEARMLLEELVAQRRKTYVPPSIMATAHAGLREVDQMVKWIEQGIEERDVMIVLTLRSWQALDPLLDYSLYRALLRKMNLEHRLRALDKPIAHHSV